MPAKHYCLAAKRQLMSEGGLNVNTSKKSVGGLPKACLCNCKGRNLCQFRFGRRSGQVGFYWQSNVHCK